MNLPALEQFRLETRDNGLAHLVFDCPGRTMNVFSEAAIAEINAVAAWLAGAEVTGLLIRSGKANAFCAGADLTELGVAYDMIMERPPHERFETAFDHFFRLSRGLRALETAGKPVAVAIAGLALGGGCELALAGHYRVLVDDPKIGLGLPELLVGLLPGAGGTQRLPRLIGIDAALPVLLEGKRLSGSEALDAGLVDSLCAPGAEIAAAEQWLLATPHACQPWDRDDYESADAALVSDRIAPVREQVLAATLGHHPAELAILDCVEFGMPQMFDGAIRSEMAIFARLIQRAEARNMIQTLFLAKTEHDRMKRKQALPPFVAEAVAAANQAIARESAEHGDALAAAGFRGMADRTEPVRSRVRDGYWIDGEGPLQAEARAALDRIGGALGGIARGHGPDELRIADYAIVAEAGYPAYLGGPFAWMGQAG